MLLSRDLCITYHAGDVPVVSPVGKGCSLHFIIEEDGVVPDDVYGSEQEDCRKTLNLEPFVFVLSWRLGSGRRRGPGAC